MATNYILAPGERLIQCPYNTSHHVTNDRFIRHLTKCRSAFLKGLTPEGKERAMKICRHNARHHVPFPEIKYHEDNCQSANSLVTFLSHHNSAEGEKQYQERRKLDEESQKRHRSPSPPPSHSRHKKGRHHRDRESSDSSRNREGMTEQESYPEEEDWETDSRGHTAGYDPNLKLKSEIIIQNPSGLTKSERKVFREGNRQRATEKAYESQVHDDRDLNDNNATTNSDIKPDLRNLANANVKREPGEIQDDEEGETPSFSSQSGGSRDNVNEHSHRSTDVPSSSSSTHRSTSHSNNGQQSSAQSSDSCRPSTSRSNIGSWYEKGKRDSDNELDSDDYAGDDPYAFVFSKKKP